MSRVQTIHVKLGLCSKEEVKIHLDATLGMDEYELSDYLHKNKVYVVDGVWWTIIHKKELEEYGFTHIIEKDRSYTEFITQFYNGGTCLSEIVESVLKDEE